MPAIRAVYQEHPETHESGVWVRLLNGNLIGRALSDLPEPPANWTVQDANAYVQDWIEQRTGSRIVLTVTFKGIRPYVLDTVTVEEGTEQSSLMRLVR